eukprot:CAMPEP_0174229214 /NCGR_PEP_ID=MMETSP0417-20130205/249_1 /TAXON_ID=242541 /ORGANISM="Mayorella sp, Strain BSH-02190019" /LENGTH=918 /DNA_ID=CAMNT_0015306737 /DNA_START=70 /DNA_END=2826 /DNA_ORIENTATION=-
MTSQSSFPLRPSLEASFEVTPVGVVPAKRKRQVSCGACGAVGHTRRSKQCLGASASTSSAAGAQEPSPAPAEGPATAEVPVVAPTPTPPARRLSMSDMGRLVFFVFDLETTGFRGNGGGEIVQVAVNVMDSDGSILQDEFNRLVRPRVPISRGDSWQVHGIDDDMVAGEPGFAEVGALLLQFLSRFSDDESKVGVLVAYNGNAFDFPFLARELAKHELQLPTFVRFTLDVLPMCRKFANELAPAASLPVPADLKLATVYRYVTHQPLQNAHDALADTRALCEVLRSGYFWKYRCDSSFLLDVAEKCSDAVPTVPTTYDTDEDIEVEEESLEPVEVDEEVAEDAEDEMGVAEDEMHDDDVSGAAALPDGWHLNTPFTGVDASSEFQQWLNNDGQRRVGLLCNPESANTPEKAFNLVYGKALNLVIKYTNQYGQYREGDGAWRDVDRQEMLKWLGICSVAAVQRRSDPPACWFSTSPILALHCVTDVMSKRRFMQILSALHVCDLDDQPERDSEDFTPLYKVQEYFSVLFQQGRKLYAPGQQLSLDETLVRAFGRIGFKVRVISKAARYGIKLYVITCSSGYVLDVMPYCGKYKDVDADLQMFKATVQVVLHLCRHYEGSSRTVYTDRFYTGLEIAQELRKRDLYMVGTIMANRIPKAVRLTNAAGKQLGRGGFKQHLYRYHDDDGHDREIGLVAWMDRKPVHVLTSHHDTTSAGVCRRRTADGLREFRRPTVVGHYNDNMGGVDIADQRRLHIQTRIHGLHRWWIRLFFYGFDVALCNAFRLFKLAIPETHRDAHITYRDFRIRLCNRWLKTPDPSDSATPAPAATAPPQHIPVSLDAIQLRCVVCAKWFDKRPLHSMGGKMERPNTTTRKCEACGVPVCAGKRRPCFNMLHESENSRQLYIADAKARRKKANTATTIT